MRKAIPYAALLASFLVVACTDTAPTDSSALRRLNAGRANFSCTGSPIEILICQLFPTGLETATGSRWDRIVSDLGTWNGTSWSGDVVQAQKHLTDLVKFIQMKTSSIDRNAISPEAPADAANRLIAAMLAYVSGGPGGSPPSPGADVVITTLPAGGAALITTPNARAGVNIPAGATSEERIIVVAENTQAETQFTQKCSGPLNTTLCQFPLFYNFESLPHLRFNVPVRVAVCLSLSGPQAPDASEHDRARLAHTSPPDPNDQTPGASEFQGIEILPLVPGEQQGDLREALLDCNGPNVIGMSPLKRALYRFARRAAKILGPKNAYAYDQGPEHTDISFSPFNGVATAPDLSVTNFSGPATAVAGSSVTINWTVENRSTAMGGNATAGSDQDTTRAFLSTDATLDAGDTFIGGTAVPPLGVGGSFPASATFNAPATAGTYFLIIQVDPNQPVTEVTLTNNTLTPPPQLTVTAAPCTGNCVLYGVNSSDDGLSTIDPSTGVETFIARLSPNVNTFTTPVAMATDPATGVIYVWNNSDPANVLLTVDRCTGLATQVNSGPQSSSGSLGALAISPITGKMYNTGYGNLYEVDKSTGVLTLIGSTGATIFGADFDANGVLYGLDAGGNTLYTINTTTGAATAVATLSQSVSTVGSIVFTPTGTLLGTAFGTAGNILFDLNKTTGAVSNIRTITGGFPPQGLGFAPACSG